ncbi:hypothetical protein EVAR_50960_1 [Eumeta japonica]|uniref:Uncharacterized protein n=1 Tax=Eumeta variegata TaxID=151549 RepID=A0A4C1XA04_EUMVA|nr:hypothetical protein EVAR_50960_1 [Eumeta japonica]
MGDSEHLLSGRFRARLPLVTGIKNRRGHRRVQLVYLNGRSQWTVSLLGQLTITYGNSSQMWALRHPLVETIWGLHETLPCSPHAPPTQSNFNHLYFKIMNHRSLHYPKYNE